MPSPSRPAPAAQGLHRLLRPATTGGAAVLCLTVLALGLPAASAGAQDRGSSADQPARSAGRYSGAGAAGALPVGDVRHAVPAGASYVSPRGDDRASGKTDAPWRTVARAVEGSRSGSTIVLRAGVYSEAVSLPAAKKLTVQAAPGERVWFDGSTVVEDWVADAGVWRAEGWRAGSTATSDAAASGGTAPAVTVLLDGEALEQVASLDELVPGTFFADAERARLYVGSDPTDREVRSSGLQTGITVSAAGSVLRGFGVRRYAGAAASAGAVVVTGDDVVLEDLHVSGNAGTGVVVQGADAQLRRVTASGNGASGIAAEGADGLVAERLRVEDNGTGDDDGATPLGGLTLTALRSASVTGSVFADNEGAGLSLHGSVQDATVTSNDSLGNTKDGMVVDGTARAVVADNLVADNGTTGLRIRNASDVSIWNNTVAGNAGRPVWLVSDDRPAAEPAAAGTQASLVSQAAAPAARTLSRVTVRNNIVTADGAGCLLCVEDTALRATAESMRVTSNGNAFHRPTSDGSTAVATWPNGTSTPDVFASLKDLRADVRQESTSADLSGARVLDERYRPTSALRKMMGKTAQPLDGAVARATGQSPGERHLGAWDVPTAASQLPSTRATTDAATATTTTGATTKRATTKATTRTTATTGTKATTTTTTEAATTTGSASSSAPSPKQGASSGSGMPRGNLPGYVQTFSDDFSGTQLDPSKWMKYSGEPGSDPGSRWAPSHVTVANGSVSLNTFREGGTWTSGGINNARAGSLTSGKYEIRMRADAAKGINAVALLWPTGDSWPPEIDFVEDRDGDRRDFTSTLHYSLDGKHKMAHGGSKSVDMTTWHTYGVEWRAGRVTYTVDGVAIKTTTSAHVPTIKMALGIQSNAVTRGAVKPDSTTPARSKVEIDWVVGYRLAG